MGISELFVIVIVGGLLFSKTARGGFVQGFVEGFTDSMKKRK